MCRNGACQGICRGKGRRRPETGCAPDFTPLTITIPVQKEPDPSETTEMPTFTDQAPPARGPRLQGIAA